MKKRECWRRRALRGIRVLGEGVKEESEGRKEEEGQQVLAHAHADCWRASITPKHVSILYARPFFPILW